MKQFIISMFVVLAFASCANDGKNEHSNHDTTKAAETTTTAPENNKQITPVFTHLYAPFASHIKHEFEP